MKRWIVLGLVVGVMVTVRLGAQEKVVKEKGLVAYWSFDEGSKSIAKDYSGNGNDANINGAKIVDGMCGKALSIGSGNYAVCGGGLELGFLFPADYSLEVWVKQSSKDPQAYISKWTGHGGKPAWWLGYYQDIVQFGDYYEGGQARITGTDIADDQWHYLVGVRESTNLSLYIDGEKVAEGQSPGEVSGDNPAEVKIGCFGDRTGWPFKGLIDEVRVYCRALTEKEIKGRYDLIKSGKKQATLEVLPSEDIEAPLVFVAVEGEMEMLYDTKESIKCSVFIASNRPASKKEEKKVLLLLTNEKDEIVDKTEVIATLEKGERKKELTASFSPKKQENYNLEVKIGDKIRMKKGIIVKDIDVLSKENIKIREERRKSGNPFYRGIVSPYAGTVYKKDGYPDIDATIAKLKDLGVNCYTYLIAYQPEKELAYLPDFCKKAVEEGIEVWGYLLPPSEFSLVKEKQNKKYPPFDDDYLKWAEALAKISLQYPNFTLWMIDDFVGNSVFTLDYTREIYEVTKKLNPKLCFGACVYYSQVDKFMESGYGSYVDAILWGYRAESTKIGPAVKNLPLEINHYYKTCPGKILIPCIYVVTRGWEPKDMPDLEYAIRAAYEQTGIAWLYCLPLNPSNSRYQVAKKLIEEWKKK
ncbi:hypothetical protein AUJ66_08170 [Candidatus Desantisbacteria bacterium CG1_02_38_46]|uniref:LamG-like jellyroll fold domain-containing protein n=1 Tax=Candidatus Desantisbacteria bacterium CG1_02_38_46 TaxID=1817893 RepID=A0A1J4SAR3_9BACT|nr:MAG: hypothetical protein AUJ66_08170 [Candidatus Desantisbacteria bacterium CG1_02_38_46]